MKLFQIQAEKGSRQ